MQKVDLLGTGLDSGYKSVTAQERQNLYIENRQDGEKGITIYGTPGLDAPFIDLGETAVRGMATYDDYFYAAHRGVFYRVNNAGVATSKGEINTTSGRVNMSHNGNQLILVDGTDGWLYEFAEDTEVTITIASPGVVTWTAHGLPDGSAIRLSTTGSLPTGLSEDTTYYVVNGTTNTFELEASVGGGAINTSGAQSGTHTAETWMYQIVAAGYPALSSVKFLDGYFLGHVADTGQFYLSGPYDGQSWDALDFATAESFPDDIVTTYVANGLVILFGEFTTEIWANTGAVDFPFARTGTAIEWGLVSPDCVSELNNALFFLGKNKLGEVQVCMMQGYSVQPISTPDLDRILNDETTLAAATSYAYLINGHPMYVLNVASKTYMYDMSTGLWSTLKSANITRHRAEIGIPYIEKILVSDYANGRIYRLSDSVYSDNGEPIELKFRSKHVLNAREYFTVDRLEVDFEAGVGLDSGQGSDPQVMMRYSKDQGHTWSAELWRDIGKVGDYKHRTFWTRLGRAWDFTFELAMTDPVKRAITGIYMDVS